MVYKVLVCVIVSLYKEEGGGMEGGRDRNLQNKERDGWRARRGGLQGKRTREKERMMEKI